MRQASPTPPISPARCGAISVLRQAASLPRCAARRSQFVQAWPKVTVHTAFERRLSNATKSVDPVWRLSGDFRYLRAARSDGAGIGHGTLAALRTGRAARRRYGRAARAHTTVRAALESGSR